MTMPISAGCWSRFRTYGIRPTKTILSTMADLAGDWFFYLSIRSDPGTDLDEYELALFVFSCVASFMGLLVLISLYLDFRRRLPDRNDGSSSTPGFGQCVKRVLGFEMILEDIPQFVLTALISADRGSLSTYAVFNISTSGFNFVLNLLDMIEIQEDAAAPPPVENYTERASGQKYAITH